MSPIIIFIIDLWFFLQFAKLAFVIGFLATKYEVETKKIEIGDSSVIWPTVGLLLSSLWVIISFIWPKETLPAMTLVVLSVSSYVTGNFFCLFTSFRPTKQGKIITSLSSVVTVGLLILMTLVMDPAPSQISLTTKIDLFFYFGMALTAGLTTFSATKNSDWEDLIDANWLLIYLFALLTIAILVVTSYFLPIDIALTIFNTNILLAIPLFSSLLIITSQIYRGSRNKYFLFVSTLLLFTVIAVIATITTITNNPPP